MLSCIEFLMFLLLPVRGYFGLNPVLDISFFLVDVRCGWISRIMDLSKEWNVARIGLWFVFRLSLLWALACLYKEIVECPFVPPRIWFCLVPGGVVASVSNSGYSVFMRLGGDLFRRVVVLLFSTSLKNLLLWHSRFGGLWQIVSNDLLCSVVVLT